MSFQKLSSGRNIPNEINVVIEIPGNSDPVKYEVDKETGLLFVDRFMTTSMHYPCNYGYIPQTLSEDNDPVDVLVDCPFALVSGSVVRCRPIGILNMEDEQGPDSKLIAVPISELAPQYGNVQKLEDLPPKLLKTIEHFFQHYKDLEEGKWVKTTGWSGVNAAKKEIKESVGRYQKSIVN